MVVEYLLPATVIGSSLAMLISAYRYSSAGGDRRPVATSVSTSYRSMVAELEIRRDAVKKAIIAVIKQAEEGKIPPDVKESLIRKFERDLEEIERELKSLRLYAKLEELREEYERLVKEYEARRAKLEEEIRRLEERLKVRHEERRREEREEKPEEEKKRRAREEDDLEELYNEISKIIEEYGVE